MILHNLWSQGQLFAFSALDGESYAENDFVGTLCGDKIGIRFFTNVKRELVITNTQKLFYEFEAVTSDYINIKFANSDNVKIIYAAKHLIIGTMSDSNYPIATVEGECNSYIKDNILIQNTNSDYTALYTFKNQFFYVYGTSEEEVIETINKGLTLNLNEIENQKLEIYEKHSLSNNNKYAALYSKCISVMKTQVYSPQGVFKRIWSTPDRLPHKHLWLWDSVFHAIGFRNINPELSQNLILALFDIQEDDGFIPHCSTYYDHSSITQPPVIAWGALKVYEKSNNKEFLKTVFKHNKQFLLWCKSNRKLTNKELFTWNTQSDKDCRCDESGMDNSPRFDIKERLFAIDFSCFMANETRCMQEIAHVLLDKESELFFKEWHDKIKKDINGTLWCKENSFYYDYAIEQTKVHKVASVASFLPLFSGVCSKEQAKALVNELKNPETFCTEFAIPSISKKDKTFGSDMWRGPVWINYNYMIAEGLREYGYTDFAEEIIQKTIEVLNYWYCKKGTLFEFYDCENLKSPNELNRKGKPVEPYDFTVKYQTIREYGWTTTLVFDLLHNKYLESAKKFKTETHLHTNESSGCARVGAEEMVEAYHKAGYSTLCICDHLKEDHLIHWGDISWEEKIDNHLIGYKKAKEAAQKYNINILLTTEIEFKKTAPNHYLLLGVTEEFLKATPNICDMSIEEFRKIAIENNIFIVQAHPFRDGNNYPTPEFVDAIEMYNSNPRHKDFSEKSLELVKKHSLCITAGSDAHRKEDVALSGITTETKIDSVEQLIDAIKEKKIKPIGV